MCRNIRTLHNFEPPATDEEVQAAALEYVRKIAGMTEAVSGQRGGLRPRRRGRRGCLATVARRPRDERAAARS